MTNMWYSMGGIYEDNSNFVLEEHVAQLSRQLQAITPLLANLRETRALCSSTAHVTQACPTNMLFPEEAMGMNTYRRPNNDPFSNTYNPGWDRHRNFSWSNNNQDRAQWNPPFQQYQGPMEPKKQSMEDMMQQLMQNQLQFQQINAQMFQALQETQKGQQANTKAIANLEMQVSQIATMLSERESGREPSQIEANPNGHEEANEVIVKSVKPYDRREEIEEKKRKQEEVETTSMEERMLKLRVQDDPVEFKMFESMKRPSEIEEFSLIDALDHVARVNLLANTFMDVDMLKAEWPPPTSVKGVHFLGHVGFNQYFFSKDRTKKMLDKDVIRKVFDPGGNQILTLHVVL